MNLPEKITLEYRAALAIKVVMAFRASLESRDNVYDGTMVPNITSITDCLTLSDEELMRQVHIMSKSDYKSILPDDEFVDNLKIDWGIKS